MRKTEAWRELSCIFAQVSGNVYRPGRQELGASAISSLGLGQPCQPQSLVWTSDGPYCSYSTRSATMKVDITEQAAERSAWEENQL